MYMTHVEDQAKEELRSLEAQHPNQFDYLKTELKSFISNLQSNHPSLAFQDNNNNSISLPTSSSAATQASCSGKKRKKSGNEEQKSIACSHKMQRIDGNVNMKGKRDRVEVVLERARACLRKIQQVKSEFVF